jgi:hypothetical protein
MAVNFLSWKAAVMSKKIIDALVNLFGNHPVYIIIGMGCLYTILELLEGRSFMKGIVSNSFYSFTKNTFFTAMILSLIGAFAYQAIVVKSNIYKNVAKSLNLTCHQKNHPTADAILHSPLLRRGERRDIVSPILSGQYRDVLMLLFDIRYGRTESAGESYNFYFRTVVAFSVQDLEIPVFTLLPVRAANMFSEMIPGEKVIAFKEDLEFSSRYIVKGLENEVLKQVFSPELRRALVQSEDPWAVGVTNDHLVIFRDKQTDLTGEDEYASYLMDAYKFFQIMVTR